jgi:LysR family transcriptional activator of nhaA
MNLKHLRNFWTVARMGGVARAADRLDLTPQTVSGQVKLLEKELGTALFRPVGRGLELTEAGKLALSFADEMLALSDEMKSALATRQEQPLAQLRVGITDMVPKSVAYRLLAPLSSLPIPMRLLCREGQIDMLLGELALHRLDMVVADRPMPPGLAIRGHSHKLGESAIGFYAAPFLAARHCNGFPSCLNNAPLLLPGSGAAVRGQIEDWLNREHLSPRIMGEFDDGALMKAFGQAGAGFFPAPALLSEEICARYAVRLVGQTDSVRESFWLVSAERRISHPAIRLLIDSAHDVLSVTHRPSNAS